MIISPVMRSLHLVLLECSIILCVALISTGASNHHKQSYKRSVQAALDDSEEMPQAEQARVDSSSSSSRLQTRFAHLRLGPDDLSDTPEEGIDDGAEHPPRRGVLRVGPEEGDQTRGGDHSRDGRLGGSHRANYGAPLSEDDGYNSTFFVRPHFNEGEEEEGLEEGEEGGEGVRGCPRCEYHEEYKRMRLEAIKAEILSRLNLKEPPKMSNKTLPQNPTISSLIDRFSRYEMPLDEPYDYNDDSSSWRTQDTYHVKPLEVLLMASKPPENKTLNESNVCYFALNSEIMMAKKTRADFAVYIRKSRAPTTRNTLLNVYKLERRGSGIIRKLVHQQQLPLNSQATGRWYRWSVDRIVRSWIRNPESNLGLEIDAYDYDGRLLAIVQTDNEMDEPLKPYLEVQVKGSSRHKRYQPTPQCKTANKKKRCCRYPLIVDFVAMEWDWILAPKQYKAYYCYGKCPFAYYRPYPHTHVITQSEVNDFIPCCTPTELNSLLLFYRNEEQTIIYGTIPGMIVESCGCI